MANPDVARNDVVGSSLRRARDPRNEIESFDHLIDEGAAVLIGVAGSSPSAMVVGAWRDPKAHLKSASPGALLLCSTCVGLRP
jgi:hypothetical protein